MIKAKLLLKNISKYEVCSCLPTGLDGRKVCSQEHYFCVQHGGYESLRRTGLSAAAETC